MTIDKGVSAPTQVPALATATNNSVDYEGWFYEFVILEMILRMIF